MKLFWVDASRGVAKSYSDLLNDIRISIRSNHIIKDDNPYNVFVGILRNLYFAKPSVVLDADMSETEIKFLNLDETVDDSNLADDTSAVETIDFFLDKVYKSRMQLYIDIYTSGTTGTPKKIRQSLSNLIRTVRRDEKMQDDVWAFAYNPTHFAGLQVFFQGLFNKNKMVYCFHGDFRQVGRDLINHKVTRISCTPTYMKMLFPSLSAKYEDVRSVTFGGEKYDKSLESKVKEYFPNAKLINVYASTEAGSLLAAKGEYFSIPERYKKEIRISEENYILIHHSLLGDSDKLVLNNEWYNTGDLVEFVDDCFFKIIGRMTDTINVGGYKVYPTEVEAILKDVEGVDNILVYGRKNSLTGAIVVADVVISKDDNPREIKQRLLEKASAELQEWKQPRLYNFIDNILLTRTGKLKRK